MCGALRRAKRIRGSVSLKSWLRRSLIAAGILFVLLAVFSLEFLSFGGQFRELQPQTPGECTTLPLSASAEDIQIDRNRSIAYLSSLDRRALVTGADVEGEVLQIDLAADPLRIDKALESAPPFFRPHGMALYRMGDGKLRLFVISHPPEQSHTVEIFEQSATGRFVHIETVRDPLLVSPNAIVAVGPRQFYVANDKGASNVWQRFRESALRAGLSTLVFHDGTTGRIVASGLKSAVGLGISPDGLRLHAAETLGKRLAEYSRNPLTGDLRFTRHIELDGSPDNVNVDVDGTLWIAIHARLLDLIRHFGDPQHPAPTTIVTYANDAVRPVYVEDGSSISAGSVGAVFDGRLYIGSITEPELRVCRLR
jgi:arylesterase/paraoxonase